MTAEKKTPPMKELGEMDECKCSHLRREHGDKKPHKCGVESTMLYAFGGTCDCTNFIPREVVP